MEHKREWVQVSIKVKQMQIHASSKGVLNGMESLIHWNWIFLNHTWYYDMIWNVWAAWKAFCVLCSMFSIVIVLSMMSFWPFWQWRRDDSQIKRCIRTYVQRQLLTLGLPDSTRFSKPVMNLNILHLVDDEYISRSHHLSRVIYPCCDAQCNKEDSEYSWLHSKQKKKCWGWHYGLLPI